MIKCRTCATVLHPKAKACNRCGFHPFAGEKYCQNCAAETQTGQVQCVQCGERLLLHRPENPQSEAINVQQSASTIEDSDSRRERLTSFVRQACAAGWTVESSSEHDVVLIGGKSCNHLVHGLVTVLGGVVSCGILLAWAPVWLTLALTQKEDRLIVHVNEYGKAEYRLVSR